MQVLAKEKKFDLEATMQGSGAIRLASIG